MVSQQKGHAKGYVEVARTVMLAEADVRSKSVCPVIAHLLMRGCHADTHLEAAVTLIVLERYKQNELLVTWIMNVLS